MKDASLLGINKLDIRSLDEPLLDMGLEDKINIAHIYGFNSLR